jgi:hypothetical protein
MIRATLGIFLLLGKFERGFAFIASTVESRRTRPFNSFVLDLKEGSTHLRVVSATVSTHINEQRPIIIEESNVQRKLSDESFLLFAARVFLGPESDSNVACQGILVQEDVVQNPLDFTIHISSSNHLHSRDQFVNNHVALLNTLLQRYLVLEEETMAFGSNKENTEKNTVTLRISFDEEDEPILHYMESIGITTMKERLPIRLSKFVPFLHKYSFLHRGTTQGGNALLLLKQLSRRRVPFIFESHKPLGTSELISLQKQILSPDIVDSIMQSMEQIKANGWLSTNPDSVDGIASLHINLVSGGKELFHDDEANSSEFSRCVCDLTSTLKPYLDQNLLPRVKELTQSKTVEISDVFLRSYGKDCSDGDPNEEEAPKEERVRYKLSPHYDITSFATCVMALDDTAIHGANGLYTISSDSGLLSTNHAALRKFFPLEKGDGVIHTYDVLHGVDVHPSLNQSRTSLIVWLVDYEGDIKHETEKSPSLKSNYPWLLDPKNDVHDFILALATDYDVDEQNERNDINDAVDSLYVKSAKKCNSFALNALAQRIDDDIVKTNSECMVDFSKWYKDHAIDHDNPFYKDSNSSALGQALWYESAMLGNVNAQISLADDIMMDVTMKMTADGTSILSSPCYKEKILMASVLFSMASVQGFNVSSSLEQIMNVYMNMSENKNNDWEEDGVIQTLLLTL